MHRAEGLVHRAAKHYAASSLGMMMKIMLRFLSPRDSAVCDRPVIS